jgi:hypothetical protein
VDKDGIDASLGLEFSLELFKRYKSSGKLQADVNRLPGVKGRGTVFLSLVDGIVVSCYFEDKNGVQSSITRDALVRLDNEKGPFEWRFHSSAPPPAKKPITSPSVPSGYYQTPVSRSNPFLLTDFAVPKIIAPLDWKQLRTWTIQQQQMLAFVWRLIDGERSVQDLKAAAKGSLSESVVEEALHVLLQLKVIRINS